uniref:Melanin concentrating hormone receptor 1 n=1 Tax=Chelydra serpentina TaxID=8475 RepID=A0A8C3SIU5_CHESE
SLNGPPQGLNSQPWLSPPVNDKSPPVINMFPLFSECPRLQSISYTSIIMPSVFGIICLFGIAGNSMVIFTVVKKSKFRWCHNVLDIFIINLSFFLAFALPFVVIVATYAQILRHMKSSVAPASQRSVRLRLRRVTRIAIAICLVFFICCHPTLIFYYTYNAAISLGYANSCLNPFVYIVLCETFRKHLVLSVKSMDVNTTEEELIEIVLGI